MDDEQIDRYADHRNATGERGEGVEVEHPRPKKKKMYKGMKSMCPKKKWFAMSRAQSWRRKNEC